MQVCAHFPKQIDIKINILGGLCFTCIHFSIFSCSSSSKTSKRRRYRSRQLQITFTSYLTRTACNPVFIMIIDAINLLVYCSKKGIEVLVY